MGKTAIEVALKKYFSYDRFRNPQDEIIASIISGKDTLAIMPTGGGKSLCYQLPAVLSDGVTIVVSPLIALMKDQVDALSARGIPSAMINSSQTWGEQLKALKSLESGKLKLAYVAPERFRAQSFMRTLKGVKISLFAVDEAHCISQWGHDFRPDYTRLGETLEMLGRPVCAAFTATATPDVREDIIRQLDLRKPSVFVSGFARPNLSFNVREVSSRAEKFSRVCELVEKYKSGIVYCSTRKSAEALSELLCGERIGHILYHGAMTPRERDKAQEEFIGKKENIAVATNAFGMGIDRPDIRFVCHYELPGSVESLYQESGRAGRDGNESYCEMLLMYSDKRVQEFFIDGANPDLSFIRNVYLALKNNADKDGNCAMGADTIAEIVSDYAKTNRSRFASYRKKSTGPNSMAVTSALSILRRYGYIERFDIPATRMRGSKLLKSEISPEDIVFPDGELEEKRRRDENKLRDVLKYAYTKECRQKWILNFFGEACEKPCGKCDNCNEEGNVKAPRVLSAEESVTVRKALSGVVRLSRKIGQRQWAPRFGRDKIIKSLCGSSEAGIVKFGLDKISTHGILKSCGKKFVQTLFDALSDAGFVETKLDGEYPLIGITESGAEILFNPEAEIEMDFPESGKIEVFNETKKSKKTAQIKNARNVFESEKRANISDVKISRFGRVGAPATSRDDLDPSDAKLYDIMSKERMKLAMIRKVKPFQIFANATLLELARSRPRTLSEAAEIKGVGKAKLASLVPTFIKIIENYDD